MGRTAIQVTQPRTKDNTFTRKNKKKGKNWHIFSEHATLQGGVLDILTMCSKSMTPDLWWDIEHAATLLGELPSNSNTDRFPRPVQ